MERYFTAKQISGIYNLSPTKLRRWESDGDLHPIKIAGGHRRYKESELPALLGPQEELVEDMIAIVTSFSARLYGKRGGQVAKKLAAIIESEVSKGEDHSDGDNLRSDT